MEVELNIGDDMLATAKEIAEARGLSIGAIVSEVVREALLASAEAERRSEGEVEVVNGFPLFPRRGGVVTAELVKRLLDEEYEELAARSRRSFVRTTLDIDEDVVGEVDKLAAARKVDAGRIVTEMLWDAFWEAGALGEEDEGKSP